VNTEIPDPTSALFEAALDHHRAGRLGDAEGGYQKVLTMEPRHAGALHYLGLVSSQRGNAAEAEQLIRQALDADPGHALYHNSLGGVLMALGQAEAAATSFQTATELKPDFAQSYSNLSACLNGLGRNSEAELAAREAIRLQPHLADAHVNLGNALETFGDSQGALASASKALELQPDHGLAHAVAGSALFTLGRSDESLLHFDRAVSLLPNNPTAHMNRGNALLDLGRLTDAESACRRATEINPTLSVAQALLGSALKQQGKVDAAGAAYRRAMAAEPNNPSFHSDLLFTLQYQADVSPQDILTESQRWNSTLGDVLPTVSPTRPAIPEDRPLRAGPEDRPLRVGYVSADLSRHSVGYFMEQILRHHDPAVIDVFCYASRRHDDERAELFQSLSPHWADITALDDSAAADLVRADQIDILVDLSGHTGGNRLPLFAQRPAPVQVTYLGYPGTTGLAAMDYRLTDEIADPAGDGDMDYSETLIRLPRGFLCYAPPTDAPLSTARAPGPFTFGSFNNVPKLNDQVVQVWSRILNAVPNARLFLKHRSFSDPQTRQHYVDQFAGYGIDETRLTLSGFVEGVEGHLSAYGQVDVALDTFPYNGTATTLEALWMGVPVVTLSGDRHAARVGASILTRAGLSHWIAGDLDAYVQVAVDAVQGKRELTALRDGLRGVLSGSYLLDGPGFTKALETTYLNLYRQNPSA
jgi:protein O-GlcNAc transferase